MAGLSGARAVGWAISVAILLGVPTGFAPSGPGVPPAPASSLGSAGGCISANPASSSHDLAVLAANLTEFAGTGLELFATLPNGSSAATYTWETGDGQVSTSTVGALRHDYAVPGLYAVCVQALDPWGHLHDNRAQLVLVPVASSASVNFRGTLPVLSGVLLSNRTSRTAPTPFLPPGSTAEVAVTAELRAQQPATQLGVPTFALSPQAPHNLSLIVLATSANGTSRARIVVAPGAAPGFYELNYSVPATTPSNGTVLRTAANFTFTFVVGSRIGGRAIPQSGPSARNRITVVEVQSAPSSLDPAFVSSTAAAELLTNLYQTLLAINGSRIGGRPGAFVPDLATCVPGGSLCRSLYGGSLISGQNYTFVINPDSRFYDPVTRAAWGVWPTDVLYSLVRSMAFSTAQCFGCSGGSLLAQALLPAGNWSWDGALHGPLNNTPRWMFGAIRINVTGLCPRAAFGRGGHGCVTIHLPAVPDLPSAGRSVLELLASPQAASVEPCGWFSAPARAVGVPYWTQGNVSGPGDRPCGGPGSPGAGVAPSTLAPTAFDDWELGVDSSPPSGVIGLTAAGSGPYALASIGAGGYNLSANPAYARDPSCVFPGCAPPAGGYVPAIAVSWVVSGPFVQSAVANGSADVAIFGYGSSGALDADVSLGLLAMKLLPTLTTEVDAFNLEYNRTAALPIAGVNLTAPSTLLADLNLRQFLVHAYPYDAALPLYAGSGGGPEVRGPGGGAIPTGSGVAVPRNVSWATGAAYANPSVVGSAGWWWARALSDPAIASACTHTRPCSFLVAYPVGDAVTGLLDRAWASSVFSISNGSVLPVVHNENYSLLATGAEYSAPGGQGPTVASGLNIGETIVDPAGSTSALYAPDSPIPYSDAVASMLAPFNASGCSTSPSFWSGRSVPIPLACQGAAYGALVSALRAAGTGTLGSSAILAYDEAEQIANDLGLYVYAGQSVRNIGLSPSIDPASLARSPLALGVQGLAWYDLGWLPSAATPLAIRGLAPTPGATTGQNLTLTGLVTGGTGGYGYNWTGLPSGCLPANLSALTCAPNATGSYHVTLFVRDTSGSAVSASAWVIVRDPAARRRSPRPG